LANLGNSVAFQLNNGKSREEIIRCLVGKNRPEPAANTYVDNFNRSLDYQQSIPDERALVAQAYKVRMVRGAVFAFAGLVITAGSYALVGPGGAFFLW